MLERKDFEKLSKSTMLKFVYAGFSPYGANTAFQSFGGNAWEFYAFDVPAARQDWIDKLNEESYPNDTARAMTRAEMLYGLSFSPDVYGWQGYKFALHEVKTGVYRVVPINDSSACDFWKK